MELDGDRRRFPFPSMHACQEQALSQGYTLAE
jgi:hypothetical protein